MPKNLKLPQKQKLAIKVKPKNLFKNKLNAINSKPSSEMKVGR